MDERGVPIHAHTVDGVLYLRAEDVLELLALNNVLPKMCARLAARVNAD